MEVVQVPLLLGVFRRVAGAALQLYLEVAVVVGPLVVMEPVPRAVMGVLAVVVGVLIQLLLTAEGVMVVSEEEEEVPGQKSTQGQQLEVMADLVAEVVGHLVEEVVQQALGAMAVVMGELRLLVDPVVARA